MSPLVVNDRILLIKTGGIVTCFETAHRKPLFGPARIENAGDYFASLVYGDGKFFCGQ